MLPFANWDLNADPVPVTVGLPLVTATVPCKACSGKVSVKLMPVRLAVEVALEFVMVNVSTDVPFTATGLAPKLLVIVSNFGSGLVQPEKTTLSKLAVEVALEPFRLSNSIEKAVELVPVVVAVPVMGPCQLPLVAVYGDTFNGRAE